MKQLFTQPYPRSREWLFGLFLLMVTLAAYQPAWNGALIWDDDGHITRPELRSVDGLAKIWTAPGAVPQYYPLVHSVFWLASHLWGELPLGYHLLNIFLHALSALLLLRILRKLRIPGALLAAWIFALHPVQVESVAWITELKNTLSGVLFLGAALVYLRFDGERGKKNYAGALALFVCGLLSKSVIATLPVSLLAIFWWKRGALSWRRDVVPLLPFFALGVFFGLFTAWVERRYIGAEGEEFALTFVERCLIAGRAFWFYLEKIFFPVNLMFIYPRWNVNPAVWWQYLFPAAALALASALWALRKRAFARAPLAAFVCFTVMLFPVLGFLDVYPFRYSFVADHFQHLAFIGPVTIAAAGIWRAAGKLTEDKKRIMLPVFSALILMALGALTWGQCGMYADSETLYRATIRKNPGCWMAQNNLGLLLANSGRPDEAIAHYRKALEANPEYFEACSNCGIALEKTGRTDDAIACYGRALKINPDFVVAHYNLGKAGCAPPT